MNRKIFVTFSNTPHCVENLETYRKAIENSDIYVPVMGGKAAYKGDNLFFKSIMGDDMGGLENVSKANGYINEHSVIFCIGNNLDKIEADYIGFCHYRRLIDLPEDIAPDSNTIYAIKMKIDQPMGIQFMLSHMPNTVREFTDFIQQYIFSMDRETVESLKRFLVSDEIFFGDLFIMHRDLFKKYFEMISTVYNIIFRMLRVFFNYSDRSYGFILERMNSFIIQRMLETDSSLKIDGLKYMPIGEF